MTIPQSLKKTSRLQGECCNGERQDLFLYSVFHMVGYGIHSFISFFHHQTCTPVGMQVVQVRAVDADSMKANRHITYSIQVGQKIGLQFGQCLKSRLFQL